MDAVLQTVIEHCAPLMDRKLMSALVLRESNGNRFAIGMDGGESAIAQPTNISDAVAVADSLIKSGKTFSVGLAQIHISNIRLFGIPLVRAFDECTSVSQGQKIYKNFYAKALAAGFRNDKAIFAALRGYNSGNIFSAISNDYASTVMSEASRVAVPTLSARRATAALRTETLISQNDQTESIELFDK